MKPENLVLRCYAVKRGGVWSAMCIDLSLAAQGATFNEARERLDAQMREYVHEALTVDREHAAELLSRKAPLYQRLTWHALNLLNKVTLRQPRRAKNFSEAFSVVPNCA